MRRWRPALLGTLLCAALLTGCSQSNGLLKEETDLLEAPLRLQQQEQPAAYWLTSGKNIFIANPSPQMCWR